MSSPKHSRKSSHPKKLNEPLETEQITPATTSAPTNLTILLVDDDRAVLESLSRVFAMEGWQIITAANGEEALEHLAQQQPDLMITDLRMFGVSGWDLLFHEKLEQPNLPIFVITALPPASVEGADRLATSFFQKPLDLYVMVATIRRLFADAQARREKL